MENSEEAVASSASMVVTPLNHIGTIMVSMPKPMGPWSSPVRVLENSQLASIPDVRIGLA